MAFGSPDTPEAARESFEIVRATVEAAAADHAYVDDSDDLVDVLWAFLHGTVSLR